MKFVFEWEQYGTAQRFVVRDKNEFVIGEVRKVKEGWWWRWLGETLHNISKYNEGKVLLIDEAKALIEELLKKHEYKIVPRTLKVMK